MEESITTSLEDAKLAVDIFKRALEYRPTFELAVVGERFLAMTKKERMHFLSDLAD